MGKLRISCNTTYPFDPYSWLTQDTLCIIHEYWTHGFKDDEYLLNEEIEICRAELLENERYVTCISYWLCSL